ncbi:hypothetical protein EV702DRAFT_1058738 [Suillus placidus]|uniref:Uncharacterized protein n=1 Tax=Suillus placidus TaxID=48579 RepID=A0A9P7D8E0_9AGAM|nr:hypothetical protein EV702DRAFT_1058738 [Suillus placidus]
MPVEPVLEHSVSHLSKYDEVPQELHRAMLRLNFPSSYVVVGAYRLFTDKSLYVPAWNKCRNGARRGLICGFAWICASYNIQRRIIKAALTNPSSIFSVRYITRFEETADDLSHETLLGFKLPFSISTYVAILLVGSQVTGIISFFVARNIRVARQRVWDQTVASRGKGPDFWQPYVEEWDSPPVVNERRGRLDRMFKMWFWKVIIQKVILLPLSLYPFVGTFIAAAFKSLSTAQELHKTYFATKKMTAHQEAVFIEERKWDYRMFGFVAALLEGLPIIGLVFTVSNRIGAAMWAHDLEKRQHYIAAQRRTSVIGRSTGFEAAQT